MPDRMFVNQVVQIGPEATPGTIVPATKRLECYTIEDGIMADVAQFRSIGHKYSIEQEELAEWMESNVSGNLDFNGSIYILNSALAKVTPTAHGSSSTAKDWTFAPPVAGAASPQTYSIEQGDSVRAHKMGFGLFTDFGYKLTRKTEVALNSTKMLHQAINDNSTMTASLPNVAVSPIVGKMAKFYLDPTSGALGTTQILMPLSFEFGTTGLFGPVWAMTGGASWNAYADLPPKTTGKIMLEANAEGMALLPYLQAGTIMYLRCDLLGPEIDVPNSIYAEFRHDMAVKFGKPAAFKDEQGIFAIEWEYEVVEDPNWSSGQSHVIRVTNLLTAL